ncbi:dipeptidase [Carnobacteriaceae bacterium zg-ZUI78]|nr:dipeptidase [Carnobacteriaceae bacterium zg-ZUI78]
MKNFVTETHQKACIDAIKTLVSYPSVLNEGENETPFGQAIQDVLEKTLDITASLGMRTYIDPKGYYGYAEIGQGQECLAVLCHLDVVPAGDLSKWQTNPFEAVINGDTIYGRGVQDDKGPSMAALFALKALVDAGVTFTKRVRFIFGTDEETLWRCLNRYNEKEESATMGFAPDSSFPLTFAEKGLLQVKLHGKGSQDFNCHLGEAFNVVPAKALYSGIYLQSVKEKLDAYGYEYSQDDTSITVLGVSKHSKDAPKGINAIIRLAKVLNDEISHDALAFLTEAIGEDATGSQLFGEIKDEPSGSLTVNVAGLTITPKNSEIRIDMRIPVLADVDFLVERLKEKASMYHLTYEQYDFLNALYVPLDSVLVKTLMSVYQEKTGDMTPAKSSGGATFARTMKNCVAFGASFPTTVQTEHQENERTLLTDIYRAMDIYAEAIYRLACHE